MNTHHLPATFSGLIVEAAGLGITLHLVNEVELSGPFGGVIACSAAAANKDDDLLVFVGDGVYDVDLESLVLTHRNQDALLTVGVAAVLDGHRYGVLNVDANGFVHGMLEKPRQVGRVDSASCGVYVVSPRVLDLFRIAPRPVDWIDVVTGLLKTGKRVVAVRVARWIDVGTPASLLELNQRLLVPDMLCRVADRLEKITEASVWIQGHPALPPSVRLEGTVLIGEDAIIGEHVRLVNTIVGPRARIGSCSVLRGTLVLPGSIVTGRAALTNQVVT